MKQPIIERIHPAGLGGVQKIYRFDNGYGASVVQTPFSYGGSDGLWEIAVLMFNAPSKDDYELTYDTPITNDVLGYLTQNQVSETLQAIRGLQPKECEHD